MSLTSFEAIGIELEKFEKSALYQHKYNKVLMIIKNHPATNPIKSHIIENVALISGIQVRAIVKHARMRFRPIGSNQKGYFWAKDHNEFSPTINHIHERWRSLFFMYQRMQETFKIEQQTSLFQE